MVTFVKLRHSEGLQLASYAKRYVLFAGVCYLNILVELYKIFF